MEDENLKNEFILNESEPGKIISELSFKEFKVIGIDNQIYILKIFKGESYISFHIKEIGDIQNIFYKKGLSIEKFCNINIIFKHLSIEELYELLIESFRDSGITIIKKENKINLNFIFGVMGKKDDISLTLEPEESKIDFEIIKLKEKIKEMESSNTKMKIEFEEYKKKMDEKINVTLKKELEKVQNENEKKIKHLENELIEKEKYINELQTGIGFIKSDFSNLIDKGKVCSSIINFGDLYFIEERIQKKFNKKIKKCELLFRESIRRMSSYDRFKDICGNKNFSIIILIMTYDRHRIGAFTDKPLGKVQSTTNSFCFSFDKQKIYDINYVELNKKNGPSFRNGFSLEFNMNGDKNCYCYNNNFGFYDKELFDYEVHRIYLE